MTRGIATHLFGGGGELTAVGPWSFELPLVDTDFLMSVSRSDGVTTNLSEIDDTIIVLECDTPQTNGTLGNERQ
ncbi:hypothetical protein ASG92_16970 [Arthrobacter sp. Soil736]|uniref:hypothetical protein n=1 Tax=Arthrobacter sp. Soil736 TaxID=1736395 RepID=UPI0006FEA205|nr:hypothetical protein [Arthrobacter sp. Soil736]KRE65672.1 hypothetical protein ASG92_16970 [Arthrobacter sp. Soil736]